MGYNITTKKGILPPFALRSVARACLSAFAILLSGGPGFSELVIEGQADRLVLTAKQESLDSIIAALSARFDVRLKSPLAANDRVTRSYTGSLHSIIRRLLDGYDFVIATRQNGSVESITVFRRSHIVAADSLPVFWTRIEPRGMLGFAN